MQKIYPILTINMFFCISTSHPPLQIPRVRHWGVTFDLVFIILRPVQVHGGCVPVQRIDGVGVGEQLREERLKDVGEVWWGWRKD